MKHTEETKRKISKIRKKWLADNPDKHPWRCSKKFKSKPCEKVKEFFKKLSIMFIEEYPPNIPERNFSIDIAMPDKKIAIEINGNQHYERTGELKSYCFNLDKWSDFLNIIKNSVKKIEFDYFNYVPRKKKMWYCKICGIEVKSNYRYCKNCKNGSSSQIPTGNISLEEKCDMRFTKEPKKFCISCGNIHKSKKDYCRKCQSCQSKKFICSCGNSKNCSSKSCMNCYCMKKRKVKNRPSKRELEKLIWKYPLTKIGKNFGVSDNSVRKWCNSYGINNLPNSSYRRRKFLELKIAPVGN